MLNERTVMIRHNASKPIVLTELCKLVQNDPKESG